MHPAPPAPARVSVVIPCHNAERYLARALDSVRAQSVVPAETVVVLDRCTDGSAAIAEALEHVQVLTTDFGHGGLARNAGVDATSSRWVAFLDADDSWKPSHLTRSLELLEREPGQVGVLNRFIAESVEGQQQERTPLPPPFDLPCSGLCDEDYLRHWAAAGWFPGMSAVIVDRLRFMKIGGFHAEMPRRHDLEMWLRLVRGQRWAWDSVVTSVYQKNTPGSISAARAEPEWYAFRAWHRQASGWTHPLVRQQVRAAARRAASAAITDGSPEQQRAMLPELIPFLRLDEQWMARLALLTPGPFAAANRLRRRWLMRNHQPLGRRHAAAPADL